MATRDLAEGQTRRSIATSAPDAYATVLARADAAADGVSCRLGDSSCASAHALRVSRAAGGRDDSVQRSLLKLQRDYGNQYVGQVLRQADGAADSGGMDAVERQIDKARGGGQAMDTPTRGHMESAFGADFSGVRIHTDDRADRLSESLSARAFTTGRDVFFRQGEYNPGASSGRELLAHELTHVVQQNGDGIQRKMHVSDPGDAQELEADQMARAVMQQEHAQPIDRKVIRRQEDEEQPVAPMRDPAQRRPEVAMTPEEEEKNKLKAKLEPGVAARQQDEEPEPE